MIFTTVSKASIEQCKANSTSPVHYIGPYARPCRCHELEQTVEEAGPPDQEMELQDLGLRKRYLHAIERAGHTKVATVADMDLPQLRRIRQLDTTGLAALAYLMARNGFALRSVLESGPGSIFRLRLQIEWERMAVKD